MGWKRIMNKKIRQADRTKEADSQMAETETNTAAWEEIEHLLNGLVPELNFRLFLETESSTKLLWVESITVTAYESAPIIDCPKSWNFSDVFLKGEGLVGQIWKRLTRMQDKLRSFKK